MMLFRGPREKLNKLAADVIVENTTKLLKQQDKVVLAVPGGRNVSGIFSVLKDRELPWEKIHLFMVDERMVPLGDKESNYSLAESTLGAVIPKENLHPFDKDKGIDSYAAELKALGGAYDIMLLSAGEDGHVGGLFPNTSINAQGDLYVEVTDSPKPPAHRMTASRKLLEQTKVCVILFMDEAKREAYNAFNSPTTQVEECPAKLVQKLPLTVVLTNLR